MKLPCTCGSTIECENTLYVEDFESFVGVVGINIIVESHIGETESVDIVLSDKDALKLISKISKILSKRNNKEEE